MPVSEAGMLKKILGYLWELLGITSLCCGFMALHIAYFHIHEVLQLPFPSRGRSP